jgi:hypothetical protein
VSSSSLSLTSDLACSPLSLPRSSSPTEAQHLHSRSSPHTSPEQPGRSPHPHRLLSIPSSANNLACSPSTTSPHTSATSVGLASTLSALSSTSHSLPTPLRSPLLVIKMSTSSDSYSIGDEAKPKSSLSSFLHKAQEKLPAFSGLQHEVRAVPSSLSPAALTSLLYLSSANKPSGSTLLRTPRRSSFSSPSRRFPESFRTSAASRGKTSCTQNPCTPGLRPSVTRTPTSSISRTASPT